MRPVAHFLLAAVALVLAGAAAIVATATGAAVALVAALPHIADLVPFETARVVVTDGRRNVEMVGMVHVAAPRFYGDVAEIVTARREAGWLVLYEEVKPDMEDAGAGMARVLESVGTTWEPARRQHPYELIAPILGEDLVLQDNGALLGKPGPSVRNVDLTLSQVVAALPSPASGLGDRPALSLDDVRRMFDDMPAWVQRRIRAAVRIVLATSTSGRYAAAVMPPVVMAAREQLVAEAILGEPGRDILVIYGQAHLNGIWRQMRNEGAAWSVVSRGSLQAFKRG